MQSQSSRTQASESSPSRSAPAQSPSLKQKLALWLAHPLRAPIHGNWSSEEVRRGAFLRRASLVSIPILILFSPIAAVNDHFWMHATYSFAVVSFPFQVLLLSRNYLRASGALYVWSLVIILAVAVGTTGGASSPFMAILYLVEMVFAVLFDQKAFRRVVVIGAVAIAATVPITTGVYGISALGLATFQIAIFVCAGQLLAYGMDGYRTEVAHSEQQRKRMERRIAHDEVLQGVSAIALRNDDIESLLTEACEVLAYGLRADAVVVRLPSIFPHLVICGEARTMAEEREASIRVYLDRVDADEQHVNQALSAQCVSPSGARPFQGCAHAAVYGGPLRLGNLLLLFPDEGLDTEEQALLNGVARLIGLAVARLQADRERTDLSNQLRHVQKLDALGRLSAGVAHDFNNLLTVVVTGTSLARELATDPETCQDLDDVLQAANSATSLTRQLLTFARQQPLEPALMAVNERLSDIGRLLYRVLGDEVHLEIELGAQTGRVAMEHGLFEQVVVNLAVNARDAMPAGGTFTVRTQHRTLDRDLARHFDVEPGDYVILEAQDTGTGMDSETVERIFEPFFTTKETGRGTGLGLATVHGIIQQLGGKIRVESELGIGTTFRLVIPRIDNEMSSSGKLHLLSSFERAPQNSSVLLVDDDDAIRAVLSRALHRRGYQVEEAASAAEALGHLERTTFDIMITDLRMPEVGGRELALSAEERWPAMPILFISGEDQVATSSGRGFLAKPFTPETLDTKLRELQVA